MSGKVTTLAALSLLAGLSAVEGQDSLQAQMPTTAELQVALDRSGFGVGLIDGKNGAKTRVALADFKTAFNISDAASLRSALGVDRHPAFKTYVVTATDTNRVGSAPKDWAEASAVPRMACESLIEVLSEKFHASENYLRRLNPAISWSTNLAGIAIKVPNVGTPGDPPKAARLSVDCAQFRLRAFDSNGCLLASFPCSIALNPSKIPTGALHVANFAANPIYVFDPANYPESPAAQKVGRKLIIPAGPNNPVGDYWLSLNVPGFGIHGTPHPETIGRHESHGCFRLTNWDIVRLSRMVKLQTPIEVTGTGSGQ